MQQWIRLAACEFIHLPEQTSVLQQVLDDFHLFVEELLRVEFEEVEGSIDRITAKIFTSMIAGPPQAHALLGIDASAPEQQKLYVERAVDMLLSSLN